MVTFDLTDVLNKSGLTIKSKEIQELLYQLSTQSASYLTRATNMLQTLSVKLLSTSRIMLIYI